MKKWTGLLLTVFAIVLGSAGTALAVSESEPNATLSLVGVNGTIGLVAVNAATQSTGCFFTLISVDLTTPQGRAAYATALVAKRSNLPVNLVYERDGLGCTLTGLLLQN
jgi:hypothetical protein